MRQKTVIFWHVEAGAVFKDRRQVAVDSLNLNVEQGRVFACSQK